MGHDREAAIEAAIKKWAALFPAQSGPVRLSCSGGAVWTPQLGLVANVHLSGEAVSQYLEADLVIAAPEELPDFDAVHARVQAVIATFNADQDVALKALERPLSETFGLRAVQLEALDFAPTDQDVERRQQALKASFGRFDAVAARMKEVYGLRLPRHTAVWAAFCASLSPLEKLGLDELGRWPAGVMIWFEDGGLDCETIDGLDPRLDMRYRCDPPEFVTVMGGDTDGLHFGLWYDDPAELPSFVAHNYARDSAETWISEATVIQELTEYVRQQIEEPDYPEEPTSLHVYALSAALDWFRDADEEALADDGPGRWADARRGEILGGMAPALPEGSGDPRATYDAYCERFAAYRDQAQSGKVSLWISQAMDELKQGKPAFALVLGRELHFLDSAPYRAASLDLLCAAYEALGRNALADIARAHHAHRDLKSVAVYLRR